MSNESEKVLKDSWENSPTANLMLSSLPNRLRIKFFAELCDFVRSVLKRRGDEPALVEFEKNLAERNSYLTEKMKAGEMSEDQASESRGSFIRDEALKATSGAAHSIANWQHPDEDMSGKSEVSEDEFLKYKEQVERELIDKLRQDVNIGGV